MTIKNQIELIQSLINLTEELGGEMVEECEEIDDCKELIKYLITKIEKTDE